MNLHITKSKNAESFYTNYYFEIEQEDGFNALC